MLWVEIFWNELLVIVMCSILFGKIKFVVLIRIFNLSVVYYFILIDMNCRKNIGWSVSFCCIFEIMFNIGLIWVGISIIILYLMLFELNWYFVLFSNNRNNLGRFVF